MLTNSYTLDNFEGPLELLVHLVQIGEIPALGLMLQKLTAQLSKQSNDLETASESLSYTASLLFMKSQKLLPGQELIEETNEDPGPGPIIAKIIELAALKDTSNLLEERLEKAAGVHRGFIHEERSRELQLPSLEELKALFEALLAKEPKGKTLAPGPVWQVKEQIQWLKKELSTQQVLRFDAIFESSQPLMRRVVTFLALLELIKHQEISLERRDDGLFLHAAAHA